MIFYRGLAFVTVAFIVLLSPVCELWADDMRPASLTIQAQDNTLFDVVWKVPAKGDKRLKLDVVFDSSVVVVKPKQTQFFSGAFIESWQIQRTEGLPGLKIYIEGLKNSSSDVLLRITNHQQQTTTAVLNIDTPNYALPVSTDMSSQNRDSTMVTYLVLGIEHILKGFDHLLFVACLVFISGTRKKLILTISGFTLAHSVTLILAATGIVKIPIAPVEAVIALSIVFLAVEIAKQNPNSVSLRYPVLVSSSFGLLHGFGFASVLADIGLPANEKITALLCFNIGVEVGQLLFVAVLCLVLYSVSFLSRLMFTESVSSRHLQLDYWSLPVSYVSGTVAMSWLLMRLSVF